MLVWSCAVAAAMLRITAFPRQRAEATVHAWLAHTRIDDGPHAHELRLFLDACATPRAHASRATVACVDGGRVCAIALIEAPPLTLVSLAAVPGNLEAGSVLCRTLRRVHDEPVVADEQLAARWRVALAYFEGA